MAKLVPHPVGAAMTLPGGAPVPLPTPAPVGGISAAGVTVTAEQLASLNAAAKPTS